jgi:hypothetical protein
MKFYGTGQEKDDLLIQVTAWVGLTMWLVSQQHQYQVVHQVHDVIFD